MDPATAASEEPILWAGLAGFTSPERARIARLMEGRAGPRWRLAAFADADAWIINGGRVRPLDDEAIRVLPAMPREAVLRIQLSDVTRPVAFATPLPMAFEPLCRFNAAIDESIEQMLDRFDHWLLPLRAQFALGRELTARLHGQGCGIVHVLREGRLLAAIDLRSGIAGVAPDLHPADLRGARWERRPPSAGGPPSTFFSCTVAQLTWTFVRHGDERLLPSRYRYRTIYYRGSPRVPLDWLSDSQRALLREVAGGSCTIEVLRQRTALPMEQVLKDLSCLYAACAITTTLAKAVRRPISPPGDAPSSRPVTEEMLDGDDRQQVVDPAPLVPHAVSRQFRPAPAPQSPP
jgi:hypothetical protein